MASRIRSRIQDYESGFVRNSHRSGTLIRLQFCRRSQDSKGQKLTAKKENFRCNILKSLIFPLELPSPARCFSLYTFGPPAYLFLVLLLLALLLSPLSDPSVVRLDRTSIWLLENSFTQSQKILFTRAKNETSDFFTHESLRKKSC